MLGWLFGRKKQNQEPATDRDDGDSSDREELPVKRKKPLRDDKAATVDDTATSTEDDITEDSTSEDDVKDNRVKRKRKGPARRVRNYNQLQFWETDDAYFLSQGIIA